LLSGTRDLLEDQKMLTLRKVLSSLGLLAIAGVVQAAPIILNGDHFTVSYDDAQAGIYGQGSLSGSLNTLYFQPTAFSALSGGSPVSTQAPLQLTFNINPGYAFAGFTFTERGDYFLFGTGAVNVAASVEAENTATSTSTLLSLTSGSSLTRTGAATPWQLTGSLSAQGLGLPQTLLVTLDNSLFADAASGNLAFIQKTYVGFNVATVAAPAAVVPEPSSWALLFAGMLAALMVGTRRHTMRV
jgi:hypothetical protein